MGATTFPVREVRAALLARATELGVSAATEEATIDALLEREVQVDPPTGAECRRFYDEHPERFRSGTVIEASHILFVPEHEQIAPALRAFAQARLEELQADAGRFAEFARRWSNCPSGAEGGRLGRLARDGVVAEFWHAIERRGRPGVLPELIETRFGLHIVEVHRVEPGPLLPFESVRMGIEQGIAQRRLQAALRDYAHALVHPHSRHDGLH
jgi:peptidyl-prolyl cis-trans isomerase C